MPKGIYKRTPRQLKVTAKKVGRPPKVVAERTISIKEASDVLQYLVKDVKGLDISFFNTSNKVNVNWNDEQFEADTAELPKVIESIKYLQSKELVFVI